MICLISSPSVQLDLLHSKFHLCSAATRGLLLSSYVKFANLFPEIKPQIQEVSAYLYDMGFFAYSNSGNVYTVIRSHLE